MSRDAKRSVAERVDAGASRLTRAGMGLFVGLPQVAGADVGVDLRRDQALVAQQFLHAADIGTAIQQMGSKAVAKRVRTRSLVEASLAQIFLQHAADTSRRESGAESVDEDRCLPARGLFWHASFRTASQACRAFVANEPSGARRSLRPLPRTLTMPWGKSRSPSLRSTSSLTRRPAE